MFKKTITIVILCILSIASIWAVWEGNAAAGSAEEFPSGLFASSDLFPTHTLIEIVNLEQNTKSRAVIVGNTGADGVLIKLSPDLAAALAVRKGTTVRVRVSIPPLVAEEGADPVQLTKKSAGSAAAAPEAVQTEPLAQLPIEEAVPTSPAEVFPVAEPEAMEEVHTIPQEVPAVIEPVQESVAAAIPSEVEEPHKDDSVAAEETPQPIAEVEKPIEPTVEEPAYSGAVTEAAAPIEPVSEQPLIAVVPAQVAPVASAVYTEPVAEIAEAAAVHNPAGETEPAASVVEVAVPEEPAAAPQEEPAVEEIALPEPPPVEDTAEAGDDTDIPLYDTDDGIPEGLSLAEETVSDDGENAEPVAESEPIETESEMVAEVAPIEQEEEMPDPIAEVAPIEPAESSQTTEPKVVAGEPLPLEESMPLAAAEPEAEPSAEDVMESPLTAEPVEQHVMLVPAEPKAPRQEDMPPPVVNKPAEAVATARAAVPAVKKEQPVARPAEEPFVTDGLKKGAFYVQIARFTDMLNVESFVQRYGKQYPISVEKNATASGSFYKVYIGPLQKDERGAALETFQRLGFKDAFLKRVP